jgi:cellulose synthase (UDP-forming)
MTPAFEDVSLAVPRPSPAKERAVRIVATIAYGYSLYWLFWRWTQSINWSSPWFSVTLVLAETFGIASTGFLIWTVWRLRTREVRPAPPGRSVDVFITCYNESVQLVRRTAIGARSIRYPHQTFVLDDGHRDEMKAMCHELGIGYITRDDNVDAKAGNLNHALAATTGEFILQLDADHVPVPTILDRLLGHFDDPGVAFVQSPQDFYNTDSFTHVVNDEGRRFWEENRIFFSLIQPGKDRMNAAFFCGSCGVIRRTAIESVGGFSTRTITEDMETSIVLHGRGWQSVYHGETLAYGLSPASAGQYHVQRLRWGQGSMQILRKMNPLTYPGLTLAQRWSYFSSVIVYVDGLQKLVFYLAPIVFLLTGWLPVRVTNHELLIRLIPYLALTILSFEMLARGTGYLLISERYNMTKFFTYILALSGYFIRRPIKFNVTPKDASDVPLKTYAPQLVLASLCVASLLWVLPAYHFGWVNYHVRGAVSVPFVANGLWVVWNLSFAIAVIRHSIRSRQQRSDHRFVERIPVDIRAVGSDGVLGVPLRANTRDFNGTGLSFRSLEPFAPGELVEIPLALSSGMTTVRGRVSHVKRGPEAYGAVFIHGVVFEDMAIDVRDRIEMHCALHSVPLWHQRYRPSRDPMSIVRQKWGSPRQGRRIRVELPAMISVTGENGEVATGIGLLEELSDEGARLILENPIEPGAKVSYEVPGTDLAGHGVVVFNRAFDSPLQVRFAVGVRRPTRSASWRGLPLIRRWTLSPGTAGG